MIKYEDLAIVWGTPNYYKYNGKQFTGVAKSTVTNNIFYIKNGLIHNDDGPAMLYGGQYSMEFWIKGKPYLYEKIIISLKKSNKFKF